MEPTRRESLWGLAACGAVAASTNLMAIHGRVSVATIDPITPESFGAIGDGRTNDTAAFARLAEFINDRGGGLIRLRPATYIVGSHVKGQPAGYDYGPAPIMNFRACSGPLVIQGNRAQMRCANGLRFGTFDPRTGSTTQHAMPYYGGGDLCSPYFAMISIEDCVGEIEIQDLELDGNLPGLKIGGRYGDTGWQIGCSGISLRNNRGPERIARVHTHHHALDGIYIDGLSDRNSTSVIEDCTSEYNGRQGCSIVGGRNYNFRNCRFRHTGKGGLMSAPGAGVDIEAEGSKTVRNLTFERCEFSNNAGVGLLASTGDSEGAEFDNCRFIGTTSWGAWPGKPRFRFTNCEFVGSIVNALGQRDPSRAVQFYNCRFRDDPALSPTGEVYNAKDRHPIADFPFAQNVLFKRCRFELTHRAVLPWSANRPIYEDCIMSQREAKMAYPRGVYRGVNRITGNVDLYASIILGPLTVNGKLVPQSLGSNRSQRRL